jgi:hypothetical protein
MLVFKGYGDSFADFVVENDSEKPIYVPAESSIFHTAVIREATMACRLASGAYEMQIPFPGNETIEVAPGAQLQMNYEWSLGGFRAAHEAASCHLEVQLRTSPMKRAGDPLIRSEEFKL